MIESSSSLFTCYKAVLAGERVLPAAWLGNAPPPTPRWSRRFVFLTVTRSTTGGIKLSISKLRNENISLGRYPSTVHPNIPPHASSVEDCKIDKHPFVQGVQDEICNMFGKGVDGYSWKFGNGKSQGGEMELMDNVKMSFVSIDFASYYMGCKRRGKTINDPFLLRTRRVK